MKAKKTSPKSIRFNINNLEISLKKGQFESAQELVDYLLDKYANVGMEQKIEPIKPKQELSKPLVKNATSQITDRIKASEKNNEIDDEDNPNQEVFCKTAKF